MADWTRPCVIVSVHREQARSYKGPGVFLLLLLH